MMVVLFHLHHLSSLALPSWASAVGTHFGFGVHLFFVISAFALMHTLKVHARESWIRDYLVKRFFRIAPLFYLMLVVYLAFFSVKGWALPDGRTILLSIFFVFNFVPGKEEGIVWASWTIGVEMIFYAVLPVVLAVTKSVRGFLVLFVGSVLVSFLSRYSLESSGGVLAKYAYAAFISNAGIFAAGLLACAVFRRINEAELAVRMRASRVLGMGLLALVVLLFTPVAVLLLGPGRPDSYVWGTVFGTLVLWQAFAPARILSNRVMVWIGERSYSVYLLHPILIILMAPVNKWLYQSIEPLLGNGAFFVCAVVTLATLLAASAVSYRFVEAPGMALGRRLLQARRPAGLTVAP